MKIVENIFREAHSLKGAARSVDFTHIEALCQSLENVFSALKNQKIPLKPETLNVFHQTIDTISQLISSSLEGKAASFSDKIKEIKDHLSRIEAGEAVEAPKKQEDTTVIKKDAIPVQFQDIETAPEIPSTLQRHSGATLQLRCLEEGMGEGYSPVKGTSEVIGAARRGETVGNGQGALGENLNLPRLEPRLHKIP